MPIRLRRLTLMPLLAAAALAAGPVGAGPCKTTHSGACAHDGAACGAPTSHGQCETYTHRVWRGPSTSHCDCRIPTPHGHLVVP